MLIDPGTAVGAGIDRLDVHQSSNLYISYEDLLKILLVMVLC